MTRPHRYAAIPARQRGAGRWHFRRTAVGFGKALIVALSFAFSAATAQAHSFSLAVVADGEHAAARLNSVVKGILLATQERDGHADETSDGHLGGLDVFVVPLPAYAAETIQGLKRVPQTAIDIAVLIGSDTGADPAAAELNSRTVVIRSGPINANAIAASTMFADKYQAEYGTGPDQWAAEGYYTARRIDLAVRALNGVDDRRALIAALATTDIGIEW